MIAVALATSALSTATLRAIPHAFDVATAIDLQPGAHLRYRVGLSPGFLDALDRHTGVTDDIVLKLLPNDWNQARAIGHPWDDVAVTIAAGEANLPVDRRHIFWRLAGGRRIIPALRQAGRLQIDVINISQRTLEVQGWQRAGLASREATLDSRAGAAPTPLTVLPAFELRVLRADGSLKAVGF